MGQKNLDISKVAKRYASSILALCEDTKSAETLVNAFSNLAQAIEENENIAAILGHPHITRAAKAKLLKESMKGADDLVLRALDVIAAQGRADVVVPISKALSQQLYAQSGQVEAVLKMAMPLSKENEKAIADMVKRFTGKQPIIKPEIDSALIGGFTVKVGSTLMDASLRTKLQLLKQQLSRAA